MASKAACRLPSPRRRSPAHALSRPSRKPKCARSSWPRASKLGAVFVKAGVSGPSAGARCRRRPRGSPRPWPLGGDRPRAACGHPRRRRRTAGRPRRDRVPAGLSRRGDQPGRGEVQRGHPAEACPHGRGHRADASVVRRRVPAGPGRLAQASRLPGAGQSAITGTVRSLLWLYGSSGRA